MSGEDKVVTVLDQFGLKRLYPNNRLFRGPGASQGPLWDVNVNRPGVVKSARCARQPQEGDQPLPVNSCPFVGRLVDAVLDGRFCVDETFCPRRAYSDPALYHSCPTYVEKLKEQKAREQT